MSTAKIFVKCALTGSNMKRSSCSGRGSWLHTGAVFSDLLFTLFFLKSRIRKFGGLLWSKSLLDSRI